MIRVKQYRRVDCLFPFCPRLARKAKDQVYANVLETKGSGTVKGIRRLLGIVGPAKCQKHAIGERLNAQTQSVHAVTEQSLEAAALSRMRIGLDGELDIICKQDIAFYDMHYPIDLV